MSIISNTTVLSNFASIGQLDILRRLYQILYIPTEVYEEVNAGLEEGYLFYQEVMPVLHPFSETGWLHLAVMETNELRVFGELPPRFHKGEAACLAIADSVTGRYSLTTTPRARKLLGDGFDCPALLDVSSWPLSMD